MTAKDERGRAAPFDLELTRVIEAPRALDWKAWSDAAHPETPECETDLRPDGTIRTLTVAPGGARQAANGGFLEIVAVGRPEEMSFHDGWGTAIGRLEKVAAEFKEGVR